MKYPPGHYDLIYLSTDSSAGGPTRDLFGASADHVGERERAGCQATSMVGTI
jgi:hypothetical protein